MALDEYGLTIKRRKFVDYYLENPNNQAEAYRKAGYAGDDNTCRVEASKLLKNPNISAYIELKQKELSDKTSVSKEYIIEKAKKVLEMSLQEVPVMKYDYELKEMVETGEYQFDSKGANGALKILGDTIGAFKQKVELEDKTERGSKIDSLIENLNKRKEQKNQDANK